MKQLKDFLTLETNGQSQVFGRLASSGIELAKGSSNLLASLFEQSLSLIDSGARKVCCFALDPQMEGIRPCFY